MPNKKLNRICFFFGKIVFQLCQMRTAFLTHESRQFLQGLVSFPGAERFQRPAASRVLSFWHGATPYVYIHSASTGGLPYVLNRTTKTVCFPVYLTIINTPGQKSKEPLIKCTIGRRTALCPRSTLTYLDDKLRVSLRDALPCIPLSHLIRSSVRRRFKTIKTSDGWLRFSHKIDRTQFSNLNRIT